ncbi:unnamed protein product, partial [Polarella glacialis]
ASASSSTNTNHANSNSSNNNNNNINISSCSISLLLRSSNHRTCSPIRSHSSSNNNDNNNNNKHNSINNTKSNNNNNSNSNDATDNLSSSSAASLHSRGNNTNNNVNVNSNDNNSSSSNNSNNSKKLFPCSRRATCRCSNSSTNNSNSNNKNNNNKLFTFCKRSSEVRSCRGRHNLRSDSSSNNNSNDIISEPKQRSMPSLRIAASLLQKLLFLLTPLAARGGELWGDASCWQPAANGKEFQSELRGDLWSGGSVEHFAARGNYLWCCLSFVRQHLGHPDCWSGRDAHELGLSFERCCLSPLGAEAEAQRQASLASQAPDAFEQVSPGKFVLGLRGGDLWGLRHIDLNHPLLRQLTSLRGCDTEVWDEILFAIRLKGGCLSCSTPAGDLSRYLATEDAGCVAGKLFVAMSNFLSTPEEKLGEATADALEVRTRAAELLKLVEADLFATLQSEDLGLHLASRQTSLLERRFFDIFGVTPTQIRYILDHTWLGDDYSPIFDYGTGDSSVDSEGPGVAERPLIFDLGMSGGMDSLFYLVHGFKVLAVEANPMLALDVRTALNRYSSRVRILSAAIVSDGSESTDSEAEGSEASPMLESSLSEFGFREVSFHIHKERPDFSALDIDRVPRHKRAGTFPVRA